jgi:hypothetical protein
MADGDGAALLDLLERAALLGGWGEARGQQGGDRDCEHWDAFHVLLLEVAVFVVCRT